MATKQLNKPLVVDQLITDKFAVYCADSVDVLGAMPDNSIHLVIESPPFGHALYHHSSSDRDLSNCKDYEEFMAQYRFIVKEQGRIVMPGRMACIHCCDIPNPKGEGMFDLPGEIIRLYEENGFVYSGRITVWKEPLMVAIRTRSLHLRHDQLCKDSTLCGPAGADFIILMRKKGVNKEPVVHHYGITEYYGETDPEARVKLSLAPIPFAPEKRAGITFAERVQIWMDSLTMGVVGLREKYEGHKDPKTNKWAHWIWQHYASSVWMDIRGRNVLPYKEARESEEERHPHPTQRDNWYRCLQMYSNPGDKVLTSFMGVGTEVDCAIDLGRYGVGIDLKPSYYRQAVKNFQRDRTKELTGQGSLEMDSFDGSDGEM